MKSRGTRVDTGTRLEYVVTGPDRHREKQYEKVEDVEYFKAHSNILRIDYFYYLKALVVPLDQLLNVAFKNENGWTPDFLDEQYKQRYKRRFKTLETIKKFIEPQLTFE